MMRRTVYQFICTAHGQVLDGEPRLVLDTENGSWHVDVTTMTCAREAELVHKESCKKTWTNRTCEHLHPLRDHKRYNSQRCNSMTCWNYRHMHMWPATL